MIVFTNQRPNGESCYCKPAPLNRTAQPEFTWGIPRHCDNRDDFVLKHLKYVGTFYALNHVLSNIMLLNVREITTAITRPSLT